ncbi:hypothetical protein KEM52_000034 [Ascosphaera acerosa]|nr:hypothetical protein KEM52_000034 [Ascosphaera acerosa]
MSTSQPLPPDELARRRAEEFARMKRYISMGFLVASPVLIAMPPRKLDAYTVLLCGAFAISANHLITERTGMGVGEHLVRKMTPTVAKPLPSERAEQISAQLKAAREAQLRDPNTSVEELERLRRRTQQSKGVLERIWMGNETDDWKQRRLEEEARALEQGKGYWDLICDYVRDAWSTAEQEQQPAETVAKR